MSKRIIQIIPADDVIAEYEIDGKIEQYPVICWALMEYEDDEGIENYVVGLGICADFPFLIPSNDEIPLLRYCHTGNKANQVINNQNV